LEEIKYHQIETKNNNSSSPQYQKMVGNLKMEEEGSLFKSWKLKHCVLKNNRLVYYKVDQFENKIEGFIPLAFVHKISPVYPPKPSWILFFF
jgi:hypothetical protein